MVASIATSKRRGLIPRHFHIREAILAKLARELSIFADESGGRGGTSRYYLLTLVFHNQADSIAEKISAYEQSLLAANLPNIPFHSEPLLNGHGPYEHLPLESRKKLLYAFNILTQRLPIAYRTFVYRRREYDNPLALSAKMKRDVSNLMFDNLAFFQSFDDVKVYYDHGQDIVKRALDQSIGFVLSKNAVEQRHTSMSDYRLEQVADYLCTIELAAVKYAAKENGGTYDKFFGSIGAFKKNWLKQARRKQMNTTSLG